MFKCFYSVGGATGKLVSAFLKPIFLLGYNNNRGLYKAKKALVVLAEHTVDHRYGEFNAINYKIF